MYAYMYVCMYIYIYRCMYVCMYVCMHACMYVCTYVCMYVNMHACMYVCMYAHMHVCMYMPVCIMDVYVRIMEYSSTPYIGVTQKQMAEYSILWIWAYVTVCSDHG